MHILDILNGHLDLIVRFYNRAAEPFESTKQKIEKQEEPFSPSGEPEDYDASEYMTEWAEADDCLKLLGQCALGLAEKALKSYWCEFIMRELDNADIKCFSRAINSQKGMGWFEKYSAFLIDNTTFRWELSPVGYSQIEEINLSRNDFVHDPMIDSLWPLQTKRHFGKYPTSAFADSFYVEMTTDDTDGQTAFPARLKVTRDNLFTHIEYVRNFCAFVERQRTK